MKNKNKLIIYNNSNIYIKPININKNPIKTLKDIFSHKIKYDEFFVITGANDTIMDREDTK
jgi:hypothetical protein